VKEANSETVINCALPANSTIYIKSTPKGLIPEELANTPKARPIGKYPNTIGYDSFTPFRKYLFIFAI